MAKDIHSGKFDPLSAASQATEDEPAEDSYQPTRRPRRWPVLAVIVLVVIALAAGGGYWFWQRRTTTRHAPTAASQNSGHTTSQAAASPTFTATTKHYVSTGFTLEFDYPQDWTVAETAGSGILTVTSPPVSFKTISNTTIKGQVVLTFRNKQQALPEFDKGNAVAVRESEKIAYTKPSSAQRGSTYLSFLNYASSNYSNELDGIFITGDVGYATGQAIPKADFVPEDPIVSLTFTKCANAACSSGAPAGIAPSLWDDSQFSTSLKSMLESLTVS